MKRPGVILTVRRIWDKMKTCFCSRFNRRHRGAEISRSRLLEALDWKHHDLQRGTKRFTSTRWWSSKFCSSASSSNRTVNKNQMRNVSITKTNLGHGENERLDQRLRVSHFPLRLDVREDCGVSAHLTARSIGCQSAFHHCTALAKVTGRSSYILGT